MHTENGYICGMVPTKSLTCMNKALYAIGLALLTSLLATSCQTLETLSIDYLQPAEVTFPEQFRKVGIVNNVPLVQQEKLSLDAAKATNSLAESIAERNYFNEVVICDSALRASDPTPVSTLLTQAQIRQLAQELDVDIIIALDGILLQTKRDIEFLPDWQIYHGTVNAKVSAVTRIYIPQRKKALTTLTSTDSIYWEELGTNQAYVQAKLVGEKQMIEEASLFAGEIPVKQLLPTWKTVERAYVSGGSVNMRDAAIYIKENDWENAAKLWEKEYHSRKGKKQFYAAYNLALAYEMQDSLKTALDWIMRAQTLAVKLDKIEKKADGSLQTQSAPHYLYATLYADELQKRVNDLARLNAQTQR